MEVEKERTPNWSGDTTERRVLSIGDIRAEVTVQELIHSHSKPQDTIIYPDGLVTREINEQVSMEYNVNGRRGKGGGSAVYSTITSSMRMEIETMMMAITGSCLNLTNIQWYSWTLQACWERNGCSCTAHVWININKLSCQRQNFSNHPRKNMNWTHLK